MSQSISYSVIRYIDNNIQCRMYVDYKELLDTTRKWNISDVDDYNPDCWKAFRLTFWKETQDITDQVKHDLKF